MARRHLRVPTTPDDLIVRLEELILAASGVDVFETTLQLIVARVVDLRTGGRVFAHSGHAKRLDGAMRNLLRRIADEAPGVVAPTPILAPEPQAVAATVLREFPLDVASLPVLDAIAERLASHASKGVKGQYLTPRNVIRLAVGLAAPRATERVCDPACGSGGFLWGAAEEAGDALLFGRDIDGRALRLGRALMHFGAQAQATLEHGDSLAREAATPGFDDPFDVILTNPPFAGEVHSPSVLSTYEIAFGADRCERDVLFLERCLEMLRPGGRLAVVLPHGTLAARKYAPARRFLTQRAHVRCVVALDRSTFLPHTHQKASIVLAVKRPAPAVPAPDEETLFVVSERSGKDGRGRPKGEDDYGEVLSAWRNFGQARGWL